MRHKVLPIGSRFGKLVVRSEPTADANKYPGILTYWYRCECDCGAFKVIRSCQLTSGKSKSCGCSPHRFSKGNTPANKTHGMGNDRIYGIWNGMIYRCSNPKFKGWDHYGGRGISVCPEWQRFESFRDWAFDNGYADHLTIDRIDTNGDYSPDNCRWSTYRTQEQNRRNNISVTAWGETKVLSEWVLDSRCNVKHGQTITRRISKGFSPEDAISVCDLRKARHLP